MQKLYNENNVQEVAEAIRDRKNLEGSNSFDYKNDFKGHSDLLTVYFDNNNDGTFTTKGAAGLVTAITKKLTPGTYTISLQPISGYSLGNMYIRETGGTNATTSYTFTLNEEITKTFDIRTYNNIVKFYIMINEGTETKQYEPYCKYKLREMPEAIKELPSVQEYNEFKNYIPKATSEDGICENAIPLNASAEVDGNSYQQTTRGKNKIIEFKTKNDTAVEYYFDKTISNSFIISGLSNLTIAGFKVTIKTSNGDINLGYKDIETNKNFNFTFSITNDDLSKIQNSTNTPYIQFWKSTGFAEANFKNVMLRESTITDDTYEPYTGGIASPNPDYPQDIEVIDNGWNMVDYSKFVKTGGIGNYIYTKNTITVEYLAPYVAVKQDISILNKKYIISVDLITKGRLEISLFKNGTKIGNTETTTSTFTIDNINNTYDTVRIALSNANYSENITFTNLMMVEGTTPKPYLPYGHIGLLQKGKNYFNANIIPSNTGIVVENNGKTIKMPIDRAGGYILIEKTLSELCPNLKAGDTVYLYFDRNTTHTESNNYIYLQNTKTVWYNGYSITITQEMLDGKIAMYGNNPPVEPNVQYILSDFRIVKNATDYEPYHEPILHDINLAGNWIGKVGDVKDLLSISEKGVVELEKKIAKKIFTENDAYSLYQQSSTRSIFYTSGIDNIYEYKSTTDSSKILTTKFISISQSGTWKPGNVSRSTSAQKTLYFTIEPNKTLDDFKNILIGEPIYYPVKNPQKLTLPTTEPIKMWEGTNIFELISNLDTTYRIKYYIDYNSILNGIQTALLDAEPEI